MLIQPMVSLFFQYSARISARNCLLVPICWYTGLGVPPGEGVAGIILPYAVCRTAGCAVAGSGVAAAWGAGVGSWMIALSVAWPALCRACSSWLVSRRCAEEMP